MRKLLAASIAVLSATVAHAQSPAPGQAPVDLPVQVERPPAPAPGSVEMRLERPGKAVATRLAVDSATIVALDVPARVLVLKRRNGMEQTVKVSPDVTRLKEFAVGDVIKVEFQQTLELEYQPPGSENVAPEAGATVGVSDRDQAPAAMVSAGVQATVKVTAVDVANRLVTFQGPKGEEHEVKAGPGIQLEKLKVGDRLLATYVENVAIRLEKAPRTRP
jgi:hypothetical protein